MRLRRDLDQLEGYVPGFQPTADNWIKLNTNESPETPPAVLTALRDALDNQLRLYPDSVELESCATESAAATDLTPTT